MAKSALGIVQRYYPLVTKVVDAKTNEAIKVTAADCAYSRKKDPASCAMAKACKRDFDGAIISTAVAYLIQGTVAKRYKVPESVSREIVSFDRSHAFAPGDYELRAPNKHERLGPRQGAQPAKKRKYARVKSRNHQTVGIRSLRGAT